jgi:hypothetical protein
VEIEFLKEVAGESVGIVPAWFRRIRRIQDRPDLRTVLVRMAIYEEGGVRDED